MLNRSDRGLLAQWWFTVDRGLMSAVLLLMAAGVLISMAASPPVAERLGLDSLHFFRNQLVFLAPAVLALLGLSFLTPAQARRVGFILFLGAILLMAAALRVGPEIKGAQRWINIGPLGLQPSEFAKPGFVMVAAWFLSEQTRRPEMPGLVVALALGAMFVGLLVLQPDFGQTALVVLTLGAMLLVYGIPWVVVVGLAGLVGAGVVAVYRLVPHVASRIDRFLNPDKGDTFQVDTAIQAFRNGGFMGTGPGGGVAKRILPDAHTDYTFAVVGEELGLVACLVLMALFAFIVLRILQKAKEEPDPFPALAMSGLGIIFGFQTVINMGVNVALLPAKGMTLPFISYGGSSLIGMALAMGLVLALGRRRPWVRVPGLSLQPMPA
ncbi:MAG: cell division protein FtsW [Rhizobiales bacterium]|nr:cell division protein FtsW [Hyphomicrobiales bacterium]MBI3674309.1 cell division protein FtsW [Hyphomicrobiales bacterium]